MTTIYLDEAGSPLQQKARRQKAFSSYVRKVEGARRDEQGLHKPYQDPGGGAAVGYGHMLKPGEKPKKLTEEEARQLLEQDIRNAEFGAMRVHGPKWDRMSQRDKAIATDFVYSMGVTAYKRDWPRLQMALERGDEEAVRRESIRGFYPRGDESEGLKPLPRNKAFREHFFESGIYPVKAFGR